MSEFTIMCMYMTVSQYMYVIFCCFQLTFTFYATCPANSCGRELHPPRGQCLFGGCSCNLPWTGNDCAVELLAPVVETPVDVQVAEGSAYEHQLVLTQVMQSCKTPTNGISV